MRLTRNARRLFRWWILLFLLLVVCVSSVLELASVRWGFIAYLAGVSWLGVGGVICACVWHRAFSPEERAGAWYQLIMYSILSGAAGGWGLSFFGYAFLLWLQRHGQPLRAAQWLPICALIFGGITLLLVITPMLFARMHIVRRRHRDELGAQTLLSPWYSESRWDDRVFAVLLFIGALVCAWGGHVLDAVGLFVGGLIWCYLPIILVRVAARRAARREENSAN